MDNYVKRLLLVMLSMIGSCAFFFLLIYCTGERDTRLTIRGGDHPEFAMSGSGSMDFLVIIGPKVREAPGQAAHIQWQIVPDRHTGMRRVGSLTPITYGEVPAGYVQIYPEAGDVPPLIEEYKYTVQVVTQNANGAIKYFTIRDGKAVELPE